MSFVLSQPLNKKLMAIIGREYRRLKKESYDWVDNGCCPPRWVANEAVVAEAEQIKTMYRLLFKKDLV